MQKGIFTLVLTCAALSAGAATITVNWDGSGDYTTIQEGINAAVNGDEVIVAQGTYVENISIGGKNIVLTSTNPEDPNVVAATIIDGGDLGSVVTFDGTEDPNCILTGFTITNGIGTIPEGTNYRYGGGIYGNNTKAVISNCVIVGNEANRYGGGLAYCDGTIENCTIACNTVFWYGGGLYRCNGVIKNCTITGNTATFSGGGLYRCDGKIENCSIAGNISNVGGGLCDCEGPIVNCIVVENSLGQLHESSVPTYSCIQDWTGGEGNIDAYPLFVDTSSADPLEWDLHLRPESLCIDGGDPDHVIEPGEVDLDGNARLVDGDNDGVEIIDMGAYESPLCGEPVIRVSDLKIEFCIMEGDVNPEDQIITIRNGGGWTLVWQITEDCEWLTVLPMSGSSDGQDCEVVLSVDSNGMTHGDYQVILSVESVGAVNNPVVVEVNLYVNNNFYVPTDFSTIQEAINAAVDGDTIIVAEGQYNESIGFNGKNIVVRSTNPDDWSVVEATIIDGLYWVVNFNGTEDSTCRLEGFTITGGYSDSGGGAGIKGNGTMANISNCVIAENDAAMETYGGGIQGVNGQISHCKIINNIASGGGGGLAGCGGLIDNCLIAGNFAWAGGGALNNCDGDIVNCTIVLNKTGDEGIFRDCDGTVSNCIIWDNNGETFYDCTADITYCCFPGSDGEGNIDIEPLFMNLAEGDYRIQRWSPCADAGTNTPVGGLGVNDLDGNERLSDADCDGTAVVDMGAYEVCRGGEALIDVRPQRVYFGVYEWAGGIFEQVLTIYNAGDGATQWQIVEDCEWLDVDPAGGVADANGVELTLRADTTGLAAGVYTYELEVAAVGEVESKFVVDVVLYVVPAEGFWVPYHYETIQAAIDDANDFDEIIVVDGVYTGDGNRDIDFLGKAITVRSATGAANCIIDCQAEPHGGFRFANEEMGDSMLDGFTLSGCNIFCGTGSPTIANCVIKNNRGESGGGLYIHDGISLLSNCFFINNFAEAVGGGLYSEGECTIADCIFMGNFACMDGGGAMFRYANADITGCKFEDNSALYGSRGGGGMAAHYCSVNMDDCVFTGNRLIASVYGGGASFDWSDGSISNCSFVDNFGDGGGLCIRAGTVLIEQCLFEDNVGYTGGGILSESGSEVRQCTFRRNAAYSNFYTEGGGGIFAGADSKIIDCVFEENESDSCGGGVYLDCTYGGNPQITGCTFRGNRAVYDEPDQYLGGGGLYCWEGSPVITNSVFEYNESLYADYDYYRYGGGIYLRDCTNAIIKDCTIKGNRADGLFLNASDSLIEGCVIEKSSREGLVCYGGNLKMSNCMIVENVCGPFVYYYETPGVYLSACEFEINNSVLRNEGHSHYGWVNLECRDTSGMISNSIIWNTEGAGIWNYWGELSVVYSDISGGWEGEGNIDVEPEFVKMGYLDDNGTPEDEEDDFWVEGDYHLRWDSPCINTGDPNFVAEEGEVDIDGEPRVMAGRVDMGADEVGPKQADFTRDGRIDIDDFSVLGGSWSTGPADEKWYVLCDLFEDGLINVSDLAAFADDWLWQADWY